ncbi:MAG: RNA 2',3'-cyclic phosphodiesterase, partial [Actinobacteria bacterium]
KWVAPGDLHVTLRFLGDVPAEDLDALAAAVGEAAAGREPFTIAPAAVKAVPSARSARMVWGVFADPDGAASALASAVSSAAAPWCRHDDPKPFRPHVTLVRARGRRPVPGDALAAANAQVKATAQPMSVAHVTLFSSTLTRQGAVYEEVARMPLGRA